jgi:MraZ protein
MASAAPQFILGEFRRTLDERFRLSIPSELADPLAVEGNDCILAKERPGCLSLWSAGQWSAKLEAGVQLVQSKMQLGRLEGRVEEVQLLGRLLSTRHKNVELAGRGRLLLPEGFREFLGVEAGGELMVVGAAICIELWRPDAWIQYLEERMPEFRRLFDQLSS